MSAYVKMYSSAIIKHLEEQVVHDGRFVAYYFFDFNNHAKRTGIGCLQSLLLQICEQSPVINDSVDKLYDSCQGGSLDTDTLVRVIGTVLSDNPGSFLVVDA